MKDYPLAKFQGIAPRYAPNLKPGWAVEALNCDLTSGKIVPMNGPLLEQADANSYNSLYYHKSVWQLGNDRYFTSWKINDYDILFYLDAGTLKKTINGVTANVGQTRLAKPTTALNGIGLLTGTFSYVLTTTRSVGGFEDESGPSAVSTPLVATNNKILVTRPAITDTNVTYWNIYRLDNSSAEYQFVAQVAAATATYDDNTITADLDTALTTWYTSEQNNQIMWDKPLTALEGLIYEPYAGMLFAWIGSTLYWSEPGYPDAWPGFYSMNFPSTIMNVIPFAGTLGVLTEKGPFRVDGSHPELLQPSTTLSNEPCLSTSIGKSGNGILFISDSGIALFNLFTVKVLTDQNFTEKWFLANVTLPTALVIENDGKVYLFHSTGTIRGDFRVNPPIWDELDIIATAVHKRPDDGNLYYVDATGIQRLEGDAANPLTWTWRSGDFLADTPKEKEFVNVECIGSGTITMNLYVDGALTSTKALSFSMDRDRMLAFPEGTSGRAAQIELTGTGSVNEVILRV